MKSTLDIDRGIEGSRVFSCSSCNVYIAVGIDTECDRHLLDRLVDLTTHVGYGLVDRVRLGSIGRSNRMEADQVVGLVLDLIEEFIGDSLGKSPIRGSWELLIQVEGVDGVEFRSGLKSHGVRDGGTDDGSCEGCWIEFEYDSSHGHKAVELVAVHRSVHPEGGAFSVSVEDHHGNRYLKTV